MDLEYHALIIDDEEDICELIEISFLSIGIKSTKAYSVSDAIVALQNDEFDVCFTDLRLPDGDGFQILEYIQRNTPELPVAMMTAHGNVESAIEALKLGAFDFISKPFEVTHLRKLATDAIKTKLSAENAESKEIMHGNSKAMQHIRNLIKRLAHSQAPVYINGESGTGKELAARAIHSESSRRDAPFIAVNCGAIPEQLVESELFGHVKGAFTGADQDKVGLFEAANEGTIFLDEIADLPLDMQVKLLRTIQERTVRPVGGTKEVALNVRIISASHRHIEDLVLRNEFRQDLFYRLNVITLNLPPLRDRLEDIPILSEHLLKRINEENGTQYYLSKEAIDHLMNYSYPGNVRELGNILERATAFAVSDELTPENLQLKHNTALHKEIKKQTHEQDSPTILGEDQLEEERPPNDASDIVLPPIINDIDAYLEAIERKIIERALAENRNKTEAAKSLGISFRQFRYRLKKLKIED